MKLQTIQAYRAIIVLIISASHAIEVLGNYGFNGLDFIKIRTGGVDFLFTLSGFIIFHVYAVRTIDLNSKRHFLWRRFLRIYPLVWFFTILSLPVYFFSSNIGAGNETQVSVIINSLFLIPQPVAPVLGATWSLSHIVLFYIVFYSYLNFPKITIFFIFVWSLIFIFTLSISESISSDNTFGVWKAFLFSPFNAEFLLGCLLAKILSYKNFKGGSLLIILGATLFPLTWVFLRTSSLSLLITSIFCFASLCLISGSYQIDKRKSFKLPSLIDLIGNASYAIIIVNLPVIVALTKIFNRILIYSHFPTWVSYYAVFLSVFVVALVGIFTNQIIEPVLVKLIKKISGSKFFERSF